MAECRRRVVYIHGLKPGRLQPKIARDRIRTCGNRSRQASRRLPAALLNLGVPGYRISAMVDGLLATRGQKRDRDPGREPL